MLIFRGFWSFHIHVTLYLAFSKRSKLSTMQLRNLQQPYLWGRKTSWFRDLNRKDKSLRTHYKVMNRLKSLRKKKPVHQKITYRRTRSILIIHEHWPSRKKGFNCIPCVKTIKSNLETSHEFFVLTEGLVSLPYRNCPKCWNDVAYYK